MIIGITGKKGSGKDTVADMIVEMANFEKESFANPIKEGCAALFGFSHDQMYGDKKEEEDERYGITPRTVLQWFGTELFQYIIPSKWEEFAEKRGRSHWVKLFDERSEGVDYVIADLRFPHEAKYIKDSGGIIIKVNREEACCSDPHPSETDMEDIMPDYFIDNCGTLSDLSKKVQELLIFFNLSSPRVYISGPITGMPDDNAEAFNKAWHKFVVDQGREVINPLLFTEKPNMPWEWYMKKDIPLLLTCGEIYMLKGWENSKGALLEKQIAESLGMKVSYE